MTDEIPYMLYTGIRVRDLKRSLKFYRALGLRPVMRGKMRMENGGTWIWLRGPESPQVLELNYYPPGNRFYEDYRSGTEMVTSGSPSRTWSRSWRGCRRS